MDRLNKKGYIVISGGASSETQAVMDQMVSDMKTQPEQWNPVFKTMDDKRLQAKMANDFVQGFDQHLKLSDVNKMHFPTAQARDWNVLMSLPGGLDQAIHRNFPAISSTDLTNYELIPGSMIIPLQDNTRLKAYGWNRLIADTNECVLVTMDRGDILLHKFFINKKHQNKKKT